MGKYSCEACKKRCKKEAIRLQDKYYHLNCFTCTECRKQLSMDGFYSRNGNHYCQEDYQRLFSVKCGACGQLAEGEVMTVLGKSFHQHCFKCCKCNKLFEPGEKVTFSKEKSFCISCCKAEEIVMMKEDPVQQNSEKEIVDPEPLISVNHAPQLSQSPSKTISVNGTLGLDQSVMMKPTSKSLPKVFGMPDNRFYNMSYLERANGNLRRGAVNNYQNKSQTSTHYHRPDNFSYNNFRKDFLPDKMRHMEKLAFSKRSETHDSLMPIEREDWPGPPEPAAAYPELLREKDFSRAVVIDVENDASKQLDELIKMSRDSGTAAVLLKDFQKKKRDGSPTLNPRNASRTPSASVEPTHKPRYETPFYASPSRQLDMLPQRSRSTDNSLRERIPKEDIVRPYTSMALRSSYVLHLPYRTGSSMEGRKEYPSSEVDSQCDSRPQSAADGSFHGRYSSMRVGEVDPDTGLRLSRHSRASTLPVGLTGFSAYSKLTPATLKANEPPRVYPYEQLLEINSKPLPGLDKDALESHLSKEEFQSVFHMDAQEFYLLPPWQRNEIKIKVGLK